MTIATPILLTFGLLALTVVLLWAPLPGIRRQSAWPWCGGLVLAIGAGLHAGILDWRALLSIAVFAGLAWGVREANNRYARALLLVLTTVAALALALHKAPGFHNPMLAEGIRFSSDGVVFSLWANFDKAVVGIVLVGVFCGSARAPSGWRCCAELRRSSCRRWSSCWAWAGCWARSGRTSSGRRIRPGSWPRIS